MLVTLGAKTDPDESLLGLLRACHARIRHFAGLATELATRPGLPPATVSDAAARCHRYFAQALPLHVRDEEDSLVPRLRGKAAPLDAMLASMQAQHAAHGPPLREFLAALERCVATPADDDARARLAPLAATLSADFEVHLAEEEAVLFPAIERLLPAAEQAAVVTELRARRTAA